MYFHPACTFLQLHDIQFSLYIIRRYYIIITPICGMPNLWKACTLIMMAWSCATRRVLRIVLSNTYCVVFLHCLSSSCAPYVACFSGLFMFYCSFGIVFFFYFFLFWNRLFMSTMRINHVFCIWATYEGMPYPWNGDIWTVVVTIAITTKSATKWETVA